MKLFILGMLAAATLFFAVPFAYAQQDPGSDTNTYYGTSTPNNGSMEDNTILETAPETNTYAPPSETEVPTSASSNNTWIWLFIILGAMVVIFFIWKNGKRK